MAKVAILLADGFETIEALAPADVLRRAGEDISLVTINALPHVTTAHGIGIDCDATLDEYDFGAFGLALLELLEGAEAAQRIAAGMLVGR